MKTGCETGPSVYSLILEYLMKDGITNATLFPQLFKDPECWSGRSRSHDLPDASPKLTGRTVYLSCRSIFWELTLSIRSKNDSLTLVKEFNN